MPVNTTPALTRLGNAGRPGRFRRDESGAMTFFGLVLFILILGFGGMAVDFMRYETARAKMQGTLDRAVLAAADLDQEAPPADVVRDYFKTAGMSDLLSGDPKVEEGLNYRKVSAGAELDLPMRFVGFPRVPGHSYETARCAGHAAILTPVAASGSRAFCSALI